MLIPFKNIHLLHTRNTRDKKVTKTNVKVISNIIDTIFLKKSEKFSQK